MILYLLKIIFILSNFGFQFGNAREYLYYNQLDNEVTKDTLFFYSNNTFTCQNSTYPNYNSKVVPGLYGSSDETISADLKVFNIPHYALRILIEILFIGDIDKDDSVDISVDSTVINVKRSDFQRKGPICTGQETDQLIYFEHQFSHNTTIATVSFKSNVIKSSTKGVIYNKFLLYSQFCNEACAECTSEGCTKCVSDATLINGKCICSNGLYSKDQSCKSDCAYPYYLINGPVCLRGNCYFCLKSDCDLTTNRCNTCQQNSIYSYYDGQCLITCPSGTYRDKTFNPHRCIDCHSDCKTCTGKSLNECTSCQSPYKYHNYDQTCRSYSEKTGLTTYIPCHSSCERCEIDTLGQTECTLCADNMKRIQNTKSCVSSCPNTHFLNSSNECQLCDPSCKSCTDIGPNSCTSCASPKFFDSITHSCGDTCSDHYFPSNNYLCEVCNNACLNCFGPGEFNCTSCNSPSIIRPKDHACVNDCGSHFYLATNQCLECDDQCLECFGAGENECSSCSAPKLFEQSTHSCVDNCSTHNFKQNSDCIECHHMCLDCSGSTEQECTSCKTPKSYLPQHNSCVENCSPLYSKDSICVEKCDPLYPQENICVDTCGEHYYQLNNECIKCSESCLGCSGPNENQCTSCSVGVLKGSICEKKDHSEDNPNSSCQNNCSDSLTDESDSDSIGVGKQISFYIFITISTSWIASIGFGHIKDKILRQSLSSIQSEPQLENGGPLSDPPQTKITIPDEMMSPKLRTETEILETQAIEKPNSPQGNPSYELRKMDILKYSIQGNEWVQFIKYSDQKASRAFRGSAIYIKYLGFTFVCRQFSEENIALGVLIAILGGGLIKSAVLGIPKFLDKYQLSLISQRVISVGCIALGLTSQITQILSMKQSEDSNTSLGFGVAFIIDFLAVQQVIGAIKYISTIYCLKNGTSSRIATFFKDSYIAQKISSM